MMARPLPISVTALRGAAEQTLCRDYQLILLLGEGELLGGSSRPLKAGTLLLLSPLQTGVRLRTECDRIYAELDTAFLEEILGVPSRPWYCLEPPQSSQAAQQLMELFDLRYNQKPETELPAWQALFSLLAALEATAKKQPAVQEDSGEDSERREKMERFLRENFQSPISLNDLAAACGLSRQHASTWFHREFQIPFSEYLTRLRLEEALRMLLGTDISVTAVSELSGFPNLKAFRQAFRKQFGCTPAEYRAQCDGNRELRAPEPQTLQAVNQLMQPYRLVYGKSDRTVHISDSFDASQLSRLEPIWQDALNIDSSVACLQQSVREQLNDTQRMLRFRYARLGNVFCRELIPFYASEGRHRFTNFISLVNFLRGIGLTPMLDFGGNYEVERNGVLITGSGYSVAQKDWLGGLENLLQTSIRYWGREWLSEWRWEFRMPERLYESEEPELFLDLFEASARLVRRYLPQSQIGGPALPMDERYLPRWRAWLAGVQAREIPLDFVSMELWANHSVEETNFPGQYGEPMAHRSIGRVVSADEMLIFQKVRALRALLDAAGLGDKKLYVAAVGTTKYQAGAAQAGGHCGAFLIKAAMELSGLADGIGCWKFWNDDEEYPDEFSPVGDGCGMIGRYGLRNINWFAQWMLTQLYPGLVGRGLACMVTGDGKGRFAVLLHNCKNYSDYFCRHYLDRTGLDYTDEKLYTVHSAVQQTLRLTGVTPGRYRVMQYLIGDHHGLLAAVLRQFGDFYHWTEKEILYLAGQSMPYQHAFTLEAKEELSLQVLLQPNEAMLLTIEPEIE